MRQQVIYELAVHSGLQLSNVGRPEPSVVFLSNLKKTVETLTAALALQGWEPGINYTAVYRRLRDRDRFTAEFTAQGVLFFRVVITKRWLNPVLPVLHIDAYPRAPRKS